jgi:hypothetical protein
MTRRVLQLTAALLVLCAPLAVVAQEGQEQTGAETAAPAMGAAVEFQRPILLTSAGQSVDVKLAGVLLKRLNVDYVSMPAATPSDLDGFKTLLVVPGYSSKGLGSAGVSRDEEMKRVEDLLAAAAKAKIPVLAMHLGGKARRGVQSDDFNSVVVKASSLAIVVAQGDEDGFFTKLCTEAKVPLVVVGIIADAMKPLEEAIEPAKEEVSQK